MTANTTLSDAAPDGGPLLVSMIIPARHWDHRLVETLDSIDRQRLQVGVSVEVVVALAEGSARPHPLEPRVVANATGTIPAGLNAAIAASRGQIIARVDARSHLPPNYVATVIDTLADASVGCVGGAALVLDRGLFGSTYAIAFNSVLLGPTVYRYRRTSGPVDTAYLGSWRRRDLELLGGFDTELHRNQDNELADRVRTAGQTVWYDARLVVGYYNDRDLRGALHHHHEFGLWRMIQRGRGQRSLTRRHRASLAALAAATVIGAGTLAAPRTRSLVARAAIVGYLSAGVVAWRSASNLRAARPDLITEPFHPLAPLLAPGLAAALDASWIAGILRGALRSQRGS